MSECPKCGWPTPDCVCVRKARALAEPYRRVVCSNCERGREACEWCHDVETIDYETICDCGLADFGSHLLDCTRRAGYRWVVAESYASAAEKL